MALISDNIVTRYSDKKALSIQAFFLLIECNTRTFN